jgi:protein phosphatase 2C family protein 2/3
MGDAEAKLPKYNGIPNVISAEPEVFSFKISDEHDFLILGCNSLKKYFLGDGIFDKMSTKDVI